MAKRDWTRSRKFREREEKYLPGTVLRDGRRVADAPRDDLAARAARAEQDWLQGRSVDDRRPTRTASKPAPRASVGDPKSIEAKLLHQVVMAVINAGKADLLRELADVNAYYNCQLPTVADVIGGRPKTAIVTGDVSFDDLVYSFRCAQTVRR